MQYCLSAFSSTPIRRRRGRPHDRAPDAAGPDPSRRSYADGGLDREPPSGGARRPTLTRQQGLRRKRKILDAAGLPYDIGGVLDQSTWTAAEIEARCKLLGEVLTTPSGNCPWICPHGRPPARSRPPLSQVPPIANNVPMAGYESGRQARPPGRSCRATGPETPRRLAVRRLLHAAGLRYRVHYRPEPSLRGPRTLCSRSSASRSSSTAATGTHARSTGTSARRTPITGRPNSQRNVARDADTTAQLEAAGWTVLRFWEHEIRRGRARGCWRHPCLPR